MSAALSMSLETALVASIHELGRVVATCGKCGPITFAQWKRLRRVGFLDLYGQPCTEAEAHLETRDCSCGSTLSIVLEDR